MLLHNLFDAASALIVVGGTCAGTVLRCGIGDTKVALEAIIGLGGKRFDPAQARAELAAHVREIQRDGVLRAEPVHLGDAELDQVTDALIGSRSLSGLHATHLAFKRRRNRNGMRAVRTLNQAADLGPVFGLAGTLVSLSQMPAALGQGGDFTAAISMAVLTTLYGLLIGNIVFAPLSRMVARRAAREERDRQRVLDWLEKQLADALPSPAAATGATVVRHRAVAGSSR